jgi:hypothetical protein
MFLNLCCIFICGDERQAWGNFLYTKQRGTRVDWSLLVYWRMKLSVLLDSPGQLWFSLWTQPSPSTFHLRITSAMKLDYTELSQTDLLHFEWAEGWNETTGRKPPVWQDHDFFIQFCCIVKIHSKVQQKFLLCSSIVTNVGKYWLLQKLQAVFARSLCLVILRKALTYRCNMFRISWHVYSREMWIDYNVQEFAFWWGMLSGRISIIKFDLTHVLIFFYMTRSTPIGEATAFFTLHDLWLFLRPSLDTNFKLMS